MFGSRRGSRAPQVSNNRKAMRSFTSNNKITGYVLLAVILLFLYLNGTGGGVGTDAPLSSTTKFDDGSGPVNLKGETDNGNSKVLRRKDKGGKPSSWKDRVLIVILGGGLTSSGDVPAHTLLRVEHAYELYQTMKEDALFVTLSGGTPHKPNPLDARGFPVWEATAAARKLISLGVPTEQVLEENFSLDTVGNAYFLRSVHTEPSGIRKLIVITNEWHMPRTQAIFEFVFGLPNRDDELSPSASSSSWPSTFSLFSSPSSTAESSSDYQLKFHAVEAGIPDLHLLELRRHKEIGALAVFNTKVRPRLHSFEDMHRFIFTEHGAYKSARLLVNHSNDSISAELLKTY